MYVRREIRALSPADTEAFLSSALSLWAISDEDGKARFGSDYHSVSFLLKYHHFNAGQQKTDHIHNGNGIVLVLVILSCDTVCKFVSALLDTYSFNWLRTYRYVNWFLHL